MSLACQPLERTLCGRLVFLLAIREYDLKRWRHCKSIVYWVFYGNIRCTQILGTNGRMRSQCVPGPFSRVGRGLGMRLYVYCVQRTYCITSKIQRKTNNNIMLDFRPIFRANYTWACILLPFIAYTYDNFYENWDYFLLFDKGCRMIRGAESLEEIQYLSSWTSHAECHCIVFLPLTVCVFRCWTGLTIMDTSVSHSTCLDSVYLIS